MMIIIKCSFRYFSVFKNKHLSAAFIRGICIAKDFRLGLLCNIQLWLVLLFLFGIDRCYLLIDVYLVKQFKQ